MAFHKLKHLGTLIIAANIGIAVSCNQKDSIKDIGKPLTLIKQVCIEESPSIGAWEGIEFYEGGFSGIYYIEGSKYEFYLINDRGPNIPAKKHPLAEGKEVKVFPFPDYSQKLVHIKTDLKSIKVLSTKPLFDETGNPLNGLPVPFVADMQNEIAWKNLNAELLPSQISGVDIEGLVFENDSVFWFAEEYRPSVWKMNKHSGKKQLVYSPYQEDSANILLPEILKSRRHNRGFEGIAITFDKHVYAILQSPLLPNDNKSVNKTRLNRIVKIDPTTAQTSFYCYEMQDAKDKIKIKDWKIGDIYAIDNSRFLVLEHGSREESNAIDVYLIDLKDATEISAKEHVDIESYKDSDELINKTGIKPVTKTHLFNLIEAGYEVSLGKPEGITMIGDSLLVILNDNDYGLNSPNEDGKIIYTNVKTCLSIFRISPELRKVLQKSQ